MSAKLPQKLGTLLRRYGPNQSLLFTGAGFSHAAISVADQPIPIGRALANFLKSKTGDSSDDIGLLSKVYVKDFGEHDLFDFLIKNYKTKQVSNFHKGIISFPWRAVYTTNYDDVGEFAAAQASVAFHTYTQSNQPNEISYKSKPIIHLNGHIGSVTFRDFLQKIRLTNESYLAEEIGKSPWGQQFRSDILTSPCIIFAGYSMYDLDIERIVYTFPEMKERIFFLVEPNPPRSLTLKLEDFGQVLDAALEDLSSYLQDLQKEKESNPEVYFTNLDRFRKFPSPSKTPTDKDVQDLLIYGDLDEEIISSEILRGGSKYTLKRDCIAPIIEQIKSNTNSVVVLRSNAGNGKSICAEVIAHSLNTPDTEVFRITNNTKRTHEVICPQ